MEVRTSPCSAQNSLSSGTLRQQQQQQQGDARKSAEATQHNPAKWREKHVHRSGIKKKKKGDAWRKSSEGSFTTRSTLDNLYIFVVLIITLTTAISKPDEKMRHGEKNSDGIT